MPLTTVNLDDKYDLGKSRVFVTGFQALVRLTLMQKERDRRAGLNTAGYVTGYRGSPLGGLDQALWRAKDLLRDNRIHFEPGINEELAATAVWGSQQVNLFAGAKYDGVSACGTARGRAPTAALTCSSTPTRRGPRPMVACWWWWGTTTAPSRRRCRIRATISSRHR
jgi:indolepyruvate ferredoxin oxidoreductase